MDRRHFVTTAASALGATLAGCLGRPGSSKDDSGEQDDSNERNGEGEHPADDGRNETPTEAEIEACALVYIEEDVIGIAELRAKDEIERVEDPQTAVMSTSRRNGRVVYHVRAGWSVDYADRWVLRIEPTEPEESPADAPQSDEPPLEEATELVAHLEEAVETDTHVRFSNFDPGYETAVDAIESVAQLDLNEVVVLNHDGTPVAVELVLEPGVHGDAVKDMYYHAVDGKVYLTESEDADPMDGQRIDC